MRIQPSPLGEEQALEISSKAKLVEAARTLALSYELVQHNTTTFIPAHWESLDKGPTQDPKDQVWLPMTRQDKRRMANQVSRLLFTTDSEITNFELMLRQFATEPDHIDPQLLVKTTTGLKVIDGSGELVDPPGTFIPNYIKPVLNKDPDAKAQVFDVISGWLNSEEDAHSLLNHLATALAPAWSAVKYVLLIGDGRNGKSVLLSMLADLFGPENVSHVTRQQIADRLPVCTELNNKLLNIIFDGEMAYIKDSSMEKTLIAGEPGYVRMLYENGNTQVQTNALFIEALNSEPKTRDKSGALQKRLSRFFFPNVYPLDLEFEAKMRSPEMLGAFLALLLDHYVQKTEIAVKLKQTQAATELQTEQQLLNSPMLQYVQWLCTRDPQNIDRLRKGNMKIPALVESFMAWRVQEGFSEFSSADVTKMFKEGFTFKRASSRENGKVTKVLAIKEPKAEVIALLDMLEGDAEDEHELLDDTLVAE